MWASQDSDAVTSVYAALVNTSTPGQAIVSERTEFSSELSANAVTWFDTLVSESGGGLSVAMVSREYLLGVSTVALNCYLCDELQGPVTHIAHLLIMISPLG